MGRFGGLASRFFGDSAGFCVSVAPLCPCRARFLSGDHAQETAKANFIRLVENHNRVRKVESSRFVRLFQGSFSHATPAEVFRQCFTFLRGPGLVNRLLLLQTVGKTSELLLLLSGGRPSQERQASQDVPVRLQSVKGAACEGARLSLTSFVSTAILRFDCVTKGTRTRMDLEDGKSPWARGPRLGNTQGPTGQPEAPAWA